MLGIMQQSRRAFHEIQADCACLFSPQLASDDDFIQNLQADAIKKAFRQKVKTYHPDLCRNAPVEDIAQQTEQFRQIRESYERLLYDFEKEVCRIGAQPAACPPGAIKKGKIIAVGGAKGGIGKTMFAANLGVFLAGRGQKTVLVDLDLGGANLHLFLGEKYLRRAGINDFLNNQVASLQEITLKTRYGPQFIGGDSSQLGLANIHFARKLKLLNGLRSIDADYVILDLGGDTNYNVIDFFLAADHGIVLTTCEPASYLDAYRFMKIALYRKLNRLFGPESRYDEEKDQALVRLISEATMAADGNNIQNIDALLGRVKKHLPHHLGLVHNAVTSFTPYLVINKSPADKEARLLVERLQEVSRRRCSIWVKYLGNISYQPEIESSAKNLVPVVSRYPDGPLSIEMGEIIQAFSDSVSF
jgi:flagellar biosynthesis protein FlhG